MLGENWKIYCFFEIKVFFVRNSCHNLIYILEKIVYFQCIIVCCCWYSHLFSFPSQGRPWQGETRAAWTCRTRDGPCTTWRCRGCGCPGSSCTPGPRCRPPGHSGAVAGRSCSSWRVLKEAARSELKSTLTRLSWSCWDYLQTFCDSEEPHRASKYVFSKFLTSSFLLWHIEDNLTFFPVLEWCRLECHSL